MREPVAPDDVERRLRNLQAVARQHARPRSEPASEPARGEHAARAGWRKRLAALGPIGVLLAFFLGKLKVLIPLLKFTKLTTLLTMLLAVWAYALYWGLPFAAGFVLLIFVHEAGHALVMQRLGLHAGAPVFIPFVGAVISMKSLPRPLEMFLGLVALPLALLAGLLVVGFVLSLFVAILAQLFLGRTMAVVRHPPT